MQPLRGPELLAVIRALGTSSRRQLLELTGYLALEPDGSERADEAGFDLALREATQAAASDAGDDLRPIHDGIRRTLVKTVIALPLLDRLQEEELFDVVISLHRDYPKGREAARRWVIEAIEAIIETREDQRNGRGECLDVVKRKFTRHYVFARLSGASIRRLVLLDNAPKTPQRKASKDEALLRKLTDRELTRARSQPVRQPAIFQIWDDFKVYPLLHGSGATIKADAAHNTFGASGRGIVWAVIDSGIQADHPHFALHNTLHGQVDEWHADFTGEASPLLDGFGHGTHVAGIIAGELRASSAAGGHPQINAYIRSLKSDAPEGSREVACERQQLSAIRGIAPETQLVSMKVIDSQQQGSVSNIIAALARIQEINANGRHLRIHGINLSVGYSFNPEWFACGQSQLCVEVDRLVRSGVVVVVAAGNTGYGRLSSINDPGNAEAAITVGSTHRTMPHTYGVSYFSSKGPTGDGRLKPDLLAPGEKVLSCGAGAMAAQIAAKLAEGQVPNYVEESGTSMAAAHGSGAAAAFLSIRREFIGRPDALKQILTSTATDLGRERQFQGAGLLDLMRAIQSV